MYKSQHSSNPSFASLCSPRSLSTLIQEVPYTSRSAVEHFHHEQLHPQGRSQHRHLAQAARHQRLQRYVASPLPPSSATRKDKRKLRPNHSPHRRPRRRHHAGPAVRLRLGAGVLLVRLDGAVRPGRAAAGVPADGHGVVGRAAGEVDQDGRRVLQRRADAEHRGVRPVGGLERDAAAAERGRGRGSRGRDMDDHRGREGRRPPRNEPLGVPRPGERGEGPAAGGVLGVRGRRRRDVGAGGAGHGGAAGAEGREQSGGGAQGLGGQVVSVKVLRCARVVVTLEGRHGEGSRQVTFAVEVTVTVTVTEEQHRKEEPKDEVAESPIT